MRMLESVTLRQARILSVVRARFPWATVIVPGLVGPKPRRISVGDGYQVNIPEQVSVVYNSRRSSSSGFMVCIRPKLQGTEAE